MRTSRLVALAAILGATSCALAQPFWTLVGPVGFVERFDTPDTAAPDEVFGPPGYTLRDPIILVRGGLAEIPVVQTPAGNNVLRFRTPLQSMATVGAQFLPASENDAFPYHIASPPSSSALELIEYVYSAGSFFPAPGEPARTAADFFLTDAAEFYRFSAREPNFADLAGSVYFGATGDMNPVVPGDPTAMRYLTAVGFTPMRVCVDAAGNAIDGCEAPTGYTLGQLLSTPVNAWFAITIEDLDDVRQRVYVDRFDGAGEALVGECQTIDITYASGMISVAATLRQPDATLYVDNIRAHGYVTTRYPDANGDRIIDFIDLNLALSNFGTTTNVGYPLGDVDNDQAVDFTDLNAILGAFGQDLNN